MGLISRVRAWIGDRLGGEGAAEPTTEARSAAEDDSAGDAADRLDPSAATETRTAATDEAVDALRDVRRSTETTPEDDAPGETTDAGSDGEPSRTDPPESG